MKNFMNKEENKNFVFSIKTKKPNEKTKFVKKPNFYFGFLSVMILIFGSIFWYIKKNKNENETKPDVLVLGGSLGGTISAISASRNGSYVILVEELDWLGGQISSQGVSAMDAAPHIFVKSGIYQELSKKIKSYYGIEETQRGPGNATVGDPSFEPSVGAKIIEDMAKDSGVKIFKEHSVEKIEKKDNRIEKVTIVSKKNGDKKIIKPKIVIDGTELGEGMKLAGVPYNIGFDIYEKTNEDHAMKEKYFNEFTKTFGNRVQSVTSPFALYDKVESGYIFDTHNIKSKNGCIEEEKDGAWYKTILKAEEGKICEIEWEYKNYISDNYFINLKSYDIKEKNFAKLEVSSSQTNFSEEKKIDSESFKMRYNFIPTDSLNFKLSFSGFSLDMMELEREFLRSGIINNFDEKNMINDDEDVENEGWKNVSYVIGYSGKSYKYQRTDDQTKTYYTWKINIKESGNYNLYSIWPYDNYLSEKATYKLFSTSPKQEIARAIVNQNRDQSKWRFLENINLKKGDYELTIQNPIVLTKVLADSIYLEKVSDENFSKVSECSQAECEIKFSKNGNYDLYIKSEDLENFSGISISSKSKTKDLSKILNNETYNFIGTEIFFDEEILKISNKNSAKISILSIFRPNYKGLNLNSKNFSNQQEDSQGKIFNWVFQNEVPAMYEIFAKNKTENDVKISFNLSKTDFEALKNSEKSLTKIFIPRGEVKISSKNPNIEIMINEIPFDEEMYDRNTFMSGNISLIGSDYDLQAKNQVSWSNFRHRKMLDFEDLKFSQLDYLHNLPKETMGLTQFNTGINDFADVFTSSIETKDGLSEMIKKSEGYSLNSYFWTRNDSPTFFDEFVGCNFPNFSGDCNPKRVILSPETMGTKTGVSKFPYIREAMRLSVKNPVSENDIARYYLKCENCTPQKCDALQNSLDIESLKTRTKTECLFIKNKDFAFSDSVGVGHYQIDTHPYLNYQDRFFGNFKTFLLKIRKDKLPEESPDGFYNTETNPATIPLSSMVTNELDYFIVGSKNIGLTQLANASFRVHPTEAHIGESAGILANFAIENKINPSEILKSEKMIVKFQEKLTSGGIYIAPIEDLVFSEEEKDFFVSANMLFVKELYNGSVQISDPEIGVKIFSEPKKNLNKKTLIFFANKISDTKENLTCSLDCSENVSWDLYLKTLNQKLKFSETNSYSDLVKNFEKKFNIKIPKNESSSFISNKDFVNISWKLTKKIKY